MNAVLLWLGVYAGTTTLVSLLFTVAAIRRIGVERDVLWFGGTVTLVFGVIGACLIGLAV